jgi:hypothetical protein
MTTIKLSVKLNGQAINALNTLATKEYRDIHQQAAWIIESELQRRGLLSSEDHSGTNVPTALQTPAHSKKLHCPGVSQHSQTNPT